MLEVKELYFRHKDLKEDTLKDIKFLAESGKVTVILGPNGSGKSTLFKCIIGIGNLIKEVFMLMEKRLINFHI